MKDEIKELLKNLPPHIKSIEVTYSGAGDSGDIDEIITINKDGTSGKLPEDVRTTIRDFSCDFLDDHHGGWGNDEGGSGSIIFNPESMTIENEHNENYTSVNTTTTVTEL